MKLDVGRFKTEKWKDFVTRCIVKLCNLLPQHVAVVTNSNCFQGGFDKSIEDKAASYDATSRARGSLPQSTRCWGIGVGRVLLHPCPVCRLLRSPMSEAGCWTRKGLFGLTQQGSPKMPFCFYDSFAMGQIALSPEKARRV